MAPVASSRTKRRDWVALLVLYLVLPLAASAQSAGDSGLLFYLSGDKGLTADIARGDPQPNFADKVRVVTAGPPHGAYIEAANDQVLSWHAPGNIYAQRGTLSLCAGYASTGTATASTPS